MDAKKAMLTSLKSLRFRWTTKGLGKGARPPGVASSGQGGGEGVGCAWRCGGAVQCGGRVVVEFELFRTVAARRRARGRRDAVDARPRRRDAIDESPRAGLANSVRKQCKAAGVVEGQGVDRVDKGLEGAGAAPEFVAVFAGGFFYPGEIAGY